MQQVGIGIGGEYPAGSVSCAESTGELKSGSRNMWFILFTNSMIDWVSVAEKPYNNTVLTSKHPRTGLRYRRICPIRRRCRLQQ